MAPKKASSKKSGPAKKAAVATIKGGGKNKASKSKKATASRGVAKKAAPKKAVGKKATAVKKRAAPVRAPSEEPLEEMPQGPTWLDEQDPDDRMV